MSALEDEKIARKQVPEDARSDFLLNGVGPRYAVGFEASIYDLAAQQVVGYDGGYWEFYALSNGAWYMAPLLEGAARVSCPNGYTGHLSDDAVGIALTLIALNHLLWRIHQKDPERGAMLHDAFYALRDYAAQHEEAAGIFGVID